MDNLVITELYIFLKTIYGGLIIGFLYDLYRLFRYYRKPKKVATFFEDFIFWVIVSLISLYILLNSNYGELRGFIFIGFVTGAVLYYTLFSGLIINTLVIIFNFIFKVVKYILSIILSPVILILRLFKKPYKKISSKIGVKYRRSKRIIKLPSRIFKDMKRSTRIILKKK